MAVIETWLHQDLQEPVKVNHLDGNLFSNNGNGNRIGVVLTNNGEDLASISGTVSGYVVTADGSTVPCTGSKSGNRASILIPAAAYQPGSIFITVFVTDGTTVTTIGAVSTTVMRSRTNAQVDPGSAVTDWTQTINAAMQSVETAAANLGGIVAVPYASITFPVPLGKYTYYNNNLYRCITPIESSESFTAAHWTQVRLGDDVSDLNIALRSDTDSRILRGFEYGQNIVDYKIINGHTYIVEMKFDSNPAIAVSSSDKAGTEITKYITSAYYYGFYTFTATEDADYLRFYLTKASTGYVIISDAGNYEHYLQNEIVQLKSRPDSVISFNLVGEKHEIREYRLKAGTEYVFENGGAACAIKSCDGTSTAIETFSNSVAANTKFTFTPEYNADYLYFYALSTETVNIVTKGYLYDTAEELVNDVRDIKTLLENDQPTTFSCSTGENIFEYEFHVGTTYTVKSAGYAVAVSSCYQNGTQIEEFEHALPANSEAEFTPTVTANYVRFYSLGSQTIYLNPPPNIPERLDALEEKVDDLEQSEDIKADRPASGYENFGIDIDCSDYTVDDDVTPAIYTDYGVIALPTNYSASGRKTKLIIHCGGTGERIAYNTNPLTFWGWDYFLKKGYAVLDMNGMPSSWGTAQSFPVTNQHYCNKFLLSSYAKGYEYVVKKYNLEKEIYVTGISMGGGASALIVQSNILPVKAHAMFCPALSVYKQDYMKPWGGTDQQKTIAGQWGFPNWSTETPSQQYFLDNYEKVIGFDNLFIRTTGDKSNAMTNYGNEAEVTAFNALQKVYPVPVKIWHCEDDPTVLYRYSTFMVKMIRNAGGQAWLRSFETGEHIGGWNNGSRTDTDIDGNTVTTSIPFYEALNFLERF